MVELLDLPNEILLLVVDFLSHDDLQRFSLVNWRCNRLAASEDLWEKRCKRTWLLKCKSQDTWKESFFEYLKEFGSYVNLYPKLAKGWKNLQKILETKSPEILKSLKDGLTEEDLNAMEQELEMGKIPNSLRLFYRLCGGQDIDKASPGLMGSLADVFTHGFNSYHFFLPTFLVKEDEVNFHKTTENHEFHLMPLAVDHFRNRFCLVIPKDISGYTPTSDELPTAYSIIWECKNRIFRVAQDFESWFLDHVEKMESGVYPIENGHILRYFYEPSCVSRTGPIEVRAGWVAAQLLHNNRNLLFEYRITMTMDEDANPRHSCQLRQRHWLITHLNTGRQEEVDGDGVVGEYPIMKPGAKFSWMSRTYFSYPGGLMEGHFTMQSLTSSDTLRIECPRYNMSFPHEYKRVSDVETHAVM